MADLRRWLSEINIPVFVLIIMFNIASWMDINSIWVEIPLLINRLPEGWGLPAYIIIIITTGKSGVVSYLVFRYFYRGRIAEWILIYIIIGVGALSMLIISFVWHNTLIINGIQRSVPLFVAIVSLSFVDSMSAPIFLNYMSRYRQQYLPAFFIGAGLCSMIPALVGIGQGVGERPVCMNTTEYVYNDISSANFTINRIIASYPSPAFSVSSYFRIMFGIMLGSAVAFTLMHFLPYCKNVQEKCGHRLDRNSQDNVNQLVPRKDSLPKEQMELKHELECLKVTDNDDQTQSHNSTLARKRTSSYTKTTKQQMLKWELIFWLFHIVFGYALMYGVMGPLLSYACLPYGSSTFNLAIRLGLCMNPVVSLVALFLAVKSKLGICLLSLLGTVATGYQVYLAVMSPSPPMKGTMLGSVLVVLASTLTKGSFLYIRSCVAYVLKERGGPHALTYNGAAATLGASLGGTITFIVTMHGYHFQSEPPCPGM